MHHIKLILAGNYRQFLDWCKEEGVDPRTRSIRYIHDVHSILGMRDYEVIRYGTYYERKDFNDIEDEIKATSYRFKKKGQP